MYKITLIEDDLDLGKSMKGLFEDEGHEVIWYSRLGDVDKSKLESTDLVILDWMLPDGQGLDFLKEVRKEKYYIPIIMLTARSELLDKVVGLESGADDYMTKPFEPRELLARIRAQLRVRKDHPQEGGEKKSSSLKIDLGDIIIDADQREVIFNGNLIEMTKMEFDLLFLLGESPNRAFSREEILNKVWGYDHFPTTRTVDTHVLQIRQKLREDLIETVRGIGYKLRHTP